MNLDIREIPFSRFGSYFCISQEKDSEDVYIRDVHGGDDAPSKLFQVDIVKDGVEQEYEVRASEISLSFYLKGSLRTCCGNHHLLKKMNSILKCRM